MGPLERLRASLLMVIFMSCARHHHMMDGLFKFNDMKFVNFRIRKGVDVDEQTKRLEI